MKLITLNSHSLIEENYEEKFSRFILAMLKEKPDILALQEVNQSMEGPELSQRELEASGYVPPLSSPEALLEPAHPVRRDNHGYRCAAALRSLGFPLYWTWVPAKIGYDRFDEGVALFSPYPIRRAEGFYITGSRD